MPPRKSNVSVVSNGPEEAAAEPTPSKGSRDGAGIEDLSLPKSMISRLAKGVLPPNTQIQRDALFALHKSATVFVSYLASNANESAQAGGKKTIMPADVQAALKDCELEGFLPRLQAELTKYVEIQSDKRNTYRRKVKEGKAATNTEEGEGGEARTDAGEGVDDSGATFANGHADGDAGEGDVDRPTKKFKAEDGTAVNPDGDGGEDDSMEDSRMEREDYEDEDGDGDEAEEEEDEEEEDEDEEDGGAQLAEDDHEEDAPSISHIRDEALDERDSDSD